MEVAELSLCSAIPGRRSARFLFNQKIGVSDVGNGGFSHEKPSLRIITSSQVPIRLNFIWYANSEAYQDRMNESCFLRAFVIILNLPAVRGSDQDRTNPQ